MKRTKSLITLGLMSVVLLAPGIAGAQQPAKSPFDAIQTQLNKLQDQNIILKDQIDTLPFDPIQVLLSSIQAQLKTIQDQIASLGFSIDLRLSYMQAQHDNVQWQLDDIQEQTANLPPTWSRKLPASERFVVLADFNNEAVLDKETGLVWERSPSTSERDWWKANDYCDELSVGNRKGYRLPTKQELASLVDPSVPDKMGPKLPSSHPFSNVQWSFDTHYWSATSYVSDIFVYFARLQAFGGGYPGVTAANKYSDFFVWCVRGGQGVDYQ